MSTPFSAPVRRFLARLTNDRHIWLALLLTLPAMLPLFAPGYFFNAHDARHSVYFLVEFDRAFRGGALWPVWGPDLAVGFGYPLWLIYAPLAYFVGQGFHLLGLGFVAATKATWAVGFILGALGTYRLARRWWGPAAGLVASVAFTYAPYHLVQIYVRAALAEFMALAWLPWVVLALVALWDAPGPRRAALAALAVAALLMLHTVSVLTFMPLIAGLMLVLWLRDVRQQANRTGGLSRLDYRRQEPAKASIPNPQRPDFRSVSMPLRGTSENENVAEHPERRAIARSHPSTVAQGVRSDLPGKAASFDWSLFVKRNDLQTRSGCSPVFGLALSHPSTVAQGVRSDLPGKAASFDWSLFVKRLDLQTRSGCSPVFGLASITRATQAKMKIGPSAFIRARLRPIFGLSANPRGRPRWLTALAWTIGAAALGGLLASIFLIPMLLERNYIVESQWVSATYNYRNHFVYPRQFIDPTWGFGYSVPGPDDGMSFQLGLAIIPLALAGAAAAVRRRPVGLPHRVEALFLVFASAVALFMMTPAATALWDALPLVEMIQFPWRLLAVTTFTLALLAGLAAHWLAQYVRPGRPRSLATGALALVVLVISLPYVRADLVPVQPWRESPLAVFDFELNFKDMRGMTRWSERQPQDEDSPLIAQYLAGEEIRRAAIVAGEGKIVAQEASALRASATVRAETPVRLRFYTYYFPGWRATVDGQPAAIAPDPPNGLIGLDLPAGEHQVTVQFGSTPVRSAAAGLSLVGLALLVALAAAGARRNATAPASGVL